MDDNPVPSSRKSDTRTARHAKPVTTAPRNVVIFVPTDVHGLEVAGVMDVFNEANTQAKCATLYTMTLVSERPETIRCASGLKIIPDRSINDLMPAADTLIVAGSYGIPDTPSAAVINWLQHGCASATRYGAVCTGAFLLGGRRPHRRAQRDDPLVIRRSTQNSLSVVAGGPRQDLHS